MLSGSRLASSARVVSNLTLLVELMSMLVSIMSEQMLMFMVANWFSNPRADARRITFPLSVGTSMFPELMPANSSPSSMDHVMN